MKMKYMYCVWKIFFLKLILYIYCIDCKVLLNIYIDLEFERKRDFGVDEWICLL